MDKVLIRFPVVGQDIFNQVDDKTLSNCRYVCKFWCNFLDNGSLFWQRRIHKFTENQVEFSSHWKIATKKAPIGILKKLAIAVEEYFTLHPKDLDNQLSPLHILGVQGITSLYDHIAKHIGVVNPTCIKDGWTPIHFASLEGHLEIIKYIAEYLEDKNPATHDGVTPLHFAAFKGDCQGRLSNTYRVI